MKVALAHHWLVGMRGGERVLEELGNIFPDAAIYTMVARRNHLSERLRGHDIVTSLLDRFPGGKRYYKQALPAFPSILRRFYVLEDIKLLISSDASLIKGICVPESATHVCYCHSPPRYLWDLTETYMSQTSDLGWFGKLAFRAMIPSLRDFDRLAAQRVSHFIANSLFVQKRIREFYGRDSVVIHPPVDVEAFRHDSPRGDFYLIISELAPYKRVDLAVKAFAQLKGKKLLVIGTGSELRSLRKAATSNVEILERQPFAALKKYYETCRAFLYPQIEDFGITAVEAQAAGSPVIAYWSGGALETVIEGQTGVFFDAQTPEALADAIMRFEAHSSNFTAEACRQSAQRFRKERFHNEILAFLNDHVSAGEGKDSSYSPHYYDNPKHGENGSTRIGILAMMLLILPMALLVSLTSNVYRMQATVFRVHLESVPIRDSYTLGAH